ncbi:MAG: VPLPA-CTERM sorting domain-containing protein [Pseudomonadota bacterium]
MLRPMLLAAALVAATSTAEAAVTLPLEGSLTVTGTSETVVLGGSVTFDDTALVALGDEVAVTAIDLTALYSGVLVGADASDFTDAPRVYRTDSGFGISFFETVSFAGLTLNVEASPFGDFLEVFDGGFTTTLAQGDLSVVPLPAAVWMFGAGVAGLALVRRRARG